MGYPESRIGWGVRRPHSSSYNRYTTKGASFVRGISRFEGASDRNKLGFLIRRDLKITNILKQIGSLENLIAAYGAIKSKPGNITPGVSIETLDGVRKLKLQNLSSELLRGRFRFDPSRRVMIPKAAGGERPLSIPSPMDKLVHQAISQQLNLVFDPLFLDRSHGFRPKRGCHTAFNYIKIKFSNVN